MPNINHEAGAILELTLEMISITLSLVFGFLAGYKSFPQWKFSRIWTASAILGIGYVAWLSWTTWNHYQGWVQPVTFQPGPALIGWLQERNHEMQEGFEIVFTRMGIVGGWLFALWYGHWLTARSYLIKRGGYRKIGVWTKAHTAFLLGVVVLILLMIPLRVITLTKAFSEPANLVSPYYPTEIGEPIPWIP